jgi:uncharacterized membrane protein YagU involved in acid resistance
MIKNILSIFKGGLIATTAMTLLMLVAPMMGIPEMPIGKMLAGFMNIPVALGWVMHFVIGIILAAGYVFVWQNFMSGSDIVKGLVISLIPFIMAQVVVMPIMGAGFFSSNTPVPVMKVMGSLIGHLVYGGVLGATVKA